MSRPAKETAAAERAKRLAELAETVAEAQWLARTLAASEESSAEAIELYQRLELVRLEVQALRQASRGVLRGNTDPIWSSLVPWSRKAED